MKRLLLNQTIRIDDHQRITPHDWYNTRLDVHLHKVVYENKRQYDIRVPLNSSKDTTICISGRPNEIPHGKIITEIKKVLDNKETRTKFLDEVCKCLITDFQWKYDEAECEAIMIKIANAFNCDFTSDLSVLHKKYIRKMTDGERTYQIVIDYDAHRAYIGECLEGWEPENLNF